MFAINSEYALENAPCGFISFYADGTIVQINKTLLKWLNYSKDEVIFKKNFQDILDSGGRLYYQMYLFPLLNMQDHINEISLSILSSDNTSISCLLNASAIKDEDKSIQLIHASLFNFTDRKKYELEILRTKTQAEEEKKRFEFLANTLPSILWTALPSGKISFLNKRFFEYFSKVKVPGLAFLKKILFPGDLKLVLESAVKAMKEEKEIQWELRLRNAHGAYNWFLVKIIPCKDEEGRLSMWLGSCTDINTQKEKQLKILEELNTELSRASLNVEQKEKILQEVAFAQSHLVRSPVSKILGLISLLKNREVNEDIKYILSLLTESAEQLDIIISEIVKKSNSKAVIDVHKESGEIPE